MADTPTMTMHLEPRLKDETMRTFEPSGLSMAGAVAMFLKTAVRERGLPFEAINGKGVVR